MDETVRTDLLQLLIFPLLSLLNPVSTLAYIFFKRKHIHPHMHSLLALFLHINFLQEIYLCTFFELQNETQNFEKHKYRNITVF